MGESAPAYSMLAPIESACTYLYDFKRKYSGLEFEELDALLEKLHYSKDEIGADGASFNHNERAKVAVIKLNGVCGKITLIKDPANASVLAKIFQELVEVATSMFTLAKSVSGTTADQWDDVIQYLDVSIQLLALWEQLLAET